MYNDDDKEEEVTECYAAFPCDADHHYVTTALGNERMFHHTTVDEGDVSSRQKKVSFYEKPSSTQHTSF